MKTMEKADDQAETTARADGEVSETDAARASASEEEEGRSEVVADDTLPDIAMTETVVTETSVDRDPAAQQSPSDSPPLGQAGDDSAPQTREAKRTVDPPSSVGKAASVNGEHSDQGTLHKEADEQRKSPRKASSRKPAKETAVVVQGKESGEAPTPETKKKKKREGVKEPKSPRKRAGSEASDQRSAKVKKRAPGSQTGKNLVEQKQAGAKDKNKQAKGKPDKTPAEQRDDSVKEKNKETTAEKNKEEKTASEKDIKTNDKLEENVEGEDLTFYKSPDFLRFELFIQRTFIEEERRAHDRYRQVLNETRRRLMNCVPDDVGDGGRLGSRIMRFFFRQEQGQGDTGV